MKFKRYILFAWKKNQARGGFLDLVTSFTEVHDARAFRVEDFDTRQIIDTHTGETLISEIEDGAWSPWISGRIRMTQPARLRPTGALRDPDTAPPALPMSQREKTIALLTAAGHSVEDAERIALQYERGRAGAAQAVREAQAKAEVARRGAVADARDRKKQKTVAASVPSVNFSAANSDQKRIDHAVNFQYHRVGHD